MSYDLAVFHADAAPKDDASFLKWYRQQATAAPREGRPALRSWCRDMKERSGPFNAHTTQEMVHASFSQDEYTEVFHMAFELAGHHEVGLFDAQASTRWLPNGNRGLFHWNENSGKGGSSSDAEAVANSLLEALCESEDLEPDEEGDWMDLTQRVAAALDRARHRSPILELWNLFLSHDAVGELYIDKAELKTQMDRASERVLGHPPSSTTGWV
jgi:hypothetical protein